MLPTTTIAGPQGDLVIGRLAIGGNPISGISHLSSERDIEMADYFTTQHVKEMLRQCEENGITTLFGRADNYVMRLLREYWNDGGTIKWIAQTAPERSSLHDNIKQVVGAGASAVYIHGGVADGIRSQGEWSRLAEAVALIRDLGLPAGSATHSPSYHAVRRDAGVDIDFCMQCLYSLEGRKGRIHEHDEKGEQFNDEDRVPALEAIRANPEPTVAYKVLGAGRWSPEDAIPQVVEYLKPNDMILMGMCPDTNSNMVAENAALVEHLLNSTEVAA
jgi:hypothetical protein